MDILFRMLVTCYRESIEFDTLKYLLLSFIEKKKLQGCFKNAESNYLT